MVLTFREKEDIQRMKEIFETECNRISQKDNETRYFCLCGFALVVESETDGKKRLDVYSNVCGV